MKKYFLFLLLIFALLQPVFAQNSVISAMEYMEGIHIFGNSQSLEMMLSMEISNKQGLKERELSLQMDREDEEKILIRITAPSFLSNMKYLSRENNGKEVRWMKTSRGTRRLSSRNNSDSLFGSDFTVEDLSLTNLSDYTWSYISGDGFSTVRIRAVPLYENPSYSYKVFSVVSESRLLSGIDYFNDANTLIKRYTLLEEREQTGFNIPGKVMMKDLIKDSQTILIVKDVDLSTQFSPSVFNKANL